MARSIDLDQAVQAFFEAVLVPDLMPTALDDLARSVGARGALLSTPRFTRNLTPISNGINESFNAYIDEGWDRHDVRAVRGARWFIEHGPGFFCEDMLFSREEIQRSEYFNGFGIKHDVPWFAAAPLIGDVHDYVALSFNRRAKEGAFTSEEIQRLNRVLPNLQLAALLCSETFAAHEKGMLASLDLISKPACLLDDQGYVVQFNQKAAEIFDDQITVYNRRLVSKLPNTQQKIDEAVRAVVRPDVGGAITADTLPLDPASPGNTIVLQFIPIVGQGNDVFRHSRAIVLISTPNQTQVLGLASKLVKIFNLTSREGEVAALLAEGFSTNEIADLLRLGEGTVRFYVKKILAKSGTHRQVEFIRYVLTLAL